MLGKIIYYVDTGLFLSVLMEELLTDGEVRGSQEDIEKEVRKAISDGYILEEDDGYLNTDDTGWDKLSEMRNV